MRPMLDDLELKLVQEIDTYELRTLAEHKPPGMSGSLLQRDPCIEAVESATVPAVAR